MSPSHHIPPHPNPTDSSPKPRQKRGQTYLESTQIGAHIGADLGVVDLVGTVAGVRTHGTGAVTLVETLVGILGGQAQLAVLETLEDAGGLHGGLECCALRGDDGGCLLLSTIGVVRVEGG